MTTHTPASPEQEGEREQKVRWALGHLELWPRAYRMGSHDQRVVDTVLNEVTRLRSDLATLQAKLDALVVERVSNHEAWEQGYVAGKRDQFNAQLNEEYGDGGDAEVAGNPFPKPEKKAGQ